MTIHRLPFLLVLSALLLSSLACASHQSAIRLEGDADRDEVLAVVLRSFDAIAAKGAESEAIWREVLLERGSMSSVRAGDGERVPFTMSFEEHLQRFEGEPDSRPYLERLWDPIVLVDGDVAMVWARFDFWLDEELSHGGTDVVTLLRTEDGWKIASFAWTHEPGVSGHPDGPPDFGGE